MYRAMISVPIEVDTDEEAKQSAYETAKVLDAHVEFVGKVLDDDQMTVTGVVEQNTRFHIP